MSNTGITDADRKTPTYHAVFNLISQARDNPMRQSYGELADDCYAKIQADLQSRLDKAEAENVWKPINCCPRNRAVLIWSPDASGEGIMAGYFVTHDDDEYWVDDVDGETIDAWPTHWKPMPKKPTIHQLTTKEGS